MLRPILDVSYSREKDAELCPKEIREYIPNKIIYKKSYRYEFLFL